VEPEKILSLIPREELQAGTDVMSDKLLWTLDYVDEHGYRNLLLNPIMRLAVIEGIVTPVQFAKALPEFFVVEELRRIMNKTSLEPVPFRGSGLAYYSGLLGVPVTWEYIREALGEPRRVAVDDILSFHYRFMMGSPRDKTGYSDILADYAETLRDIYGYEELGWFTDICRDVFSNTLTAGTADLLAGLITSYVSIREHIRDPSIPRIVAVERSVNDYTASVHGFPELVLYVLHDTWLYVFEKYSGRDTLIPYVFPVTDSSTATLRYLLLRKYVVLHDHVYRGGTVLGYTFPDIGLYAMAIQKAANIDESIMSMLEEELGIRIDREFVERMRKTVSTIARERDRDKIVGELIAGVSHPVIAELESIYLHEWLLLFLRIAERMGVKLDVEHVLNMLADTRKVRRIDGEAYLVSADRSRYLFDLLVKGNWMLLVEPLLAEYISKQHPDITTAWKLVLDKLRIDHVRTAVIYAGVFLDGLLQRLVVTRGKPKEYVIARTLNIDYRSRVLKECDATIIRDPFRAIIIDDKLIVPLDRIFRDNGSVTIDMCFKTVLGGKDTPWWPADVLGNYYAVVLDIGNNTFTTVFPRETETKH